MSDYWTRRVAALAAALITVMAVAPAGAASVIVKSTGDIFLAGQPGGTSITGFFGTDTAPQNSPLKLTVTGAVLTFKAAGSTSVDTTCFADADGGCYADQSFFSPAPASDTYKGPANALIGVFLDGAAFDVATGPASLDFTDLANTALLTQSPLLHQIFFIGDGWTGNGTGTVQQFFAPTGATRLYLATADSYGSSVGNLGQLTVAVTGAEAAGAVPEPASWAMLIAGFGVIGAAARRRRTMLHPSTSN